MEQSRKIKNKTNRRDSEKSGPEGKRRCGDNYIKVIKISKTTNKSFIKKLNSMKDLEG